MKTPLLDIALMNFEQLSKFVSTATNNEHYIANPSEATDTDREICGEHLITIVVLPAIRNEHKRVDSRSRKAQESDTILAKQLSSVARSYFMDHGFIIAQNARVSRAISAKIIEEERAEAKADMISLQMENIGAIVRAQKTHKKGTIQACWDFEESECVLNKMSGSFLEFGDATTPAFVSF